MFSSNFKIEEHAVDQNGQNQHVIDLVKFFEQFFFIKDLKKNIRPKFHITIHNDVGSHKIQH
jgi:hypothetical protein